MSKRNIRWLLRKRDGREVPVWVRRLDTIGAVILVLVVVAFLVWMGFSPHP